MTTTADLRIAAHTAAANCDWYEAARLMRDAIEAYPNPEGALAQRDIARMTQLADSWKAQAMLDDFNWVGSRHHY